MKTFISISILLLSLVAAFGQTKQIMMYGDTSRTGVPFSKDPHVVNFKGRYLMYYSIPPMKNVKGSRYGNVRNDAICHAILDKGIHFKLILANISFMKE